MSNLSRRQLLKSAGIAGAGAAALAAGPASLASQVTSTASGALAGGDAGDALRLARVWLAADRRLPAGLDDTHRMFDDGSVEVLLWPGDLTRLDATGLRFELLETAQERHLAVSRENRMQVRNAARAPGETASGDYRTLAEYNADMRMLADEYPDKCRLLVLPFRSLERREVLGLEICDDVERRDGRPVYYNDGIHHAREFPAGEVPMMFAFDLLEADDLPDDDPAKARLLAVRANVRNVIVPVVNVDGFNWAREAVVDTTDPVGSLALSVASRQAYWRKNRRQYLGTHLGVANPTRLGPDDVTLEDAGLDGNPLPDAYGIDNNRNYAFGWGGDGSGVTFENQTYRGTDPFSEQETKNVQHLFETHMCTAAISHHTSGNLILWAWGDTFDDAPDNPLLEGIGRAMAEYNGYRPQKSIDLYVTTGTASDYMYGSRASISYTFEHAGNSFHPSYPDTVPAMYERNREALLFLCEQVCLLPGLRPDYGDDRVLSPAARDRMADLGVGLYDLNHAVLRGTMGRPGTVRVLKRYETQLWVQDYVNGTDGADNPLGQPSVTELQDVTYRTAADGSFELHLNPSTQPKVEFAVRRGQLPESALEAYEISFVPDDGGPGTVLRRVVVRGEDVDLGDVLRPDVLAR